MSDLICRQAAIDVARKCSVKEVTPAYMLIDKSEIMTELMLIPSAEPERKKGKWVGKEQFVNSPEFYSWQCSVCGCVLEDPTLDKPYPFCPNCGADMRGTGDNSDE